MYLDYFGLTAAPFDLTANAKYLFLTPGHREALANLQYGLATAKPITVLIGEAGTGKTTLLRAALESEFCSHIRTLCLTNPGLSRDEFVETLAAGFGLSAEAGSSKARLLAELEAALRQRRSRGEGTALIVDEAQRLSEDLLEEIRLLANIETETEKLLPLVLAGQPELADRLNQRNFRQLKQRVALRCEIGPFSLPETAAYIASRMKIAGGDATKVFTREAILAIQEVSSGMPRTINVLADNVLLTAFAAGVRLIERDLVRDVARDFDLAAAPQDPLRHSDPHAAGQAAASSAGSLFGSANTDRAGDGQDEKGDKIPTVRRFSLFGWSS